MDGLGKKMSIRKPKAELDIQLGSGIYFEMDMDYYLSGLRKELEECLTNGWSSHERTHFDDYVVTEVEPYWPILADFLKSVLPNFYNNYQKYLKERGENTTQKA